MPFLSPKSASLSGWTLAGQSLVFACGLILSWFGITSVVLAAAAFELKGAGVVMGVGILSCLGGGFCLGRALAGWHGGRRHYN